MVAAASRAERSARRQQLTGRRARAVAPRIPPVQQPRHVGLGHARRASEASRGRSPLTPTKPQPAQVYVGSELYALEPIGTAARQEPRHPAERNSLVLPLVEPQGWSRERSLHPHLRRGDHGRAGERLLRRARRAFRR